MDDGRVRDIPLAEQLHVTLHVSSLPWLQVVLLATQNRRITLLPFANVGMTLLDSDAGTGAHAGGPAPRQVGVCESQFSEPHGLSRTSKFSKAL